MTLEKVTVTLSENASEAMRRASILTGKNGTDVVSSALGLYALLLGEQASGTQFLAMRSPSDVDKLTIK